MKLRSKIQSVLILALIFLVLAFQNCGGGESSDSAQTLNDPNQYCGRETFNYLHSTYFVPQCASCHDAGLFHPRFADRLNIGASYTAALTPATSKFRESVLNNGFCGEECSLSGASPTYQIFNKWVTCR